jgi:hypothetical protein
MDLKSRYDRLRERRTGLITKSGKRISPLTAEFAARSSLRENYERVSEPPSVKLALGYMQAVEPSFTKKCYEEGERVKARLKEGVANSPSIDFAFQGSVPLDVHIRGSSDVDLLLLHNEFFTYDQTAINYKTYGNPYMGGSPVEELSSLRKKAADTLRSRYYAANVEMGPKAIRLSGGSLERDIDVVTSHWHDTVEFARSGNQDYRGIRIYDANSASTVQNLPFLHMKHIREKCQSHRGSLRKVIRLLKNLKADSDHDIALSSYDIAALAWHMTTQALTVPFSVDLVLVARARQHLGQIVANESYRNSLVAPDGSRKIFDTPQKFIGALYLHSEITELEKAIHTELAPLGITKASASSERLLERMVVL